MRDSYVGMMRGSPSTNGYAPDMWGADMGALR